MKRVFMACPFPLFMNGLTVRPVPSLFAVTTMEGVTGPTRAAAPAADKLGYVCTRPIAHESIAHRWSPSP